MPNTLKKKTNMKNLCDMQNFAMKSTQQCSLLAQRFVKQQRTDFECAQKYPNLKKKYQAA